MTTLFLTFILDRELTKLNRIIDSKIERGQPYSREAKLHKELVNRIRKVRERGSVMAIL